MGKGAAFLVGCDTLPLRDLIARLQATYCRTLGVEYLHIQDKDERRWLQERMEPALNRPSLSPDDRLLVLQNLIFAEGFEQFLQVRYPTAKRFSLEDAESLIPLLEVLIEEGAAGGVDEMVMGMAHRGRLNVLVNVLRKPYEMVLAEFEGALLARDAQGDGDVKYHLGYSRDHLTRNGGRVHLSLAPNPSHLEAINPVIVDAFLDQLAGSHGWRLGPGPAKGIREITSRVPLPAALGSSTNRLVAADKSREVRIST